MGQNSHMAQSPQNHNRNHAMSDDPADGHRLTDKPGPVGKTPAGKKPAGDQHNQATIEEFGREGMGVAPKE